MRQKMRTPKTTQMSDGQSRVRGARSKATQAVRDFEKSRDSLLEFVEDNEELFNTFLALADDYNSALTFAKGHLKAMKTDTAITIGPFTRAKDTQNKVTYKPGCMPSEYLQVPGVIKALDTKRIEELVQLGEFDEDEVVGARVEEPGRAASVSGPKEIVVKL